MTMKICPNCKAEVEDTFDACWNCCYSFDDGKVIPWKTDAPQSLWQPELAPQYTPAEMDCLRCDVPMRYAGEYRFLEGTRTGVFGNIFELFQNRESFDLYVCSKCGKVEFFVPQEDK